MVPASTEETRFKSSLYEAKRLQRSYAVCRDYKIQAICCWVLEPNQDDSDEIY